MTAEQTYRLSLLKGAVKAKIAYWDAENALEVAVGIEGDAISDCISNMAAASDDVHWIGEAELDSFLKVIGVNS